MKSEPRSQQIWVTKQASEFQQQASQCLEERKEILAKCPRCNHDMEDGEHVLLCQSEGAKKQWKCTGGSIVPKMQKEDNLNAAEQYVQFDNTNINN